MTVCRRRRSLQGQEVLHSVVVAKAEVRANEERRCEQRRVGVAHAEWIDEELEQSIIPSIPVGNISARGHSECDPLLNKQAGKRDRGQVIKVSVGDA